jgi:hypothetical protein
MSLLAFCLTRCLAIWIWKNLALVDCFCCFTLVQSSWKWKWTWHSLIYILTDIKTTLQGPQSEEQLPYSAFCILTVANQKLQHGQSTIVPHSFSKPSRHTTPGKTIRIDNIFCLWPGNEICGRWEMKCLANPLHPCHDPPLNQDKGKKN